MDEKKAIIYSAICFFLGMFVISTIVFWPIAIWQLWKYNQIKKAKILIKEIGMDNINVYKQKNLLSSGDNAAKTMKSVCPKCNTEYEEGAFFCKNDGEKLILK